MERRLTKERTQHFSVEFKVLEVYALRALINASTRRITRKFALGSKVSSLATGRLVPGNEENAGLTAFVDPIPVRALLGLRDRIMKVCLELNPKTELLHEIVVPEAWCGTGVRNKVALAEKALIAMFLISITECWLPHRDYADKICGGTRTSHISKAGFFEHELRFDNVPAVKAKCPLAKAIDVIRLGEGIVWKATDNTQTRNFSSSLKVTCMQ